MYLPDNLNLHLSVIHIWYQCHALPSIVQPSRRGNGFIYYTKGKGQEFYFDNKIYRAQLGDFLFLPNGAKYSNRKLSEDTEYYEIDFNLYDEKNAACPLFDTPYVVPKHEASEYFNLIKETYDIFTDIESSRNFVCFGNICKMVDMLCASKNAKSREPYGINRILHSVTYIREHFDQETTLAKLAEISSLSVSSFEKIFKKSYGLSPIAYRNLLRINHAKSLLLNGYTISETAEMVGFSNYFYFCKLFKNKTGLSPGEFVRFDRGT